MVVREDADLGCVVIVPLPEEPEYVEVDISESWPQWRCDFCSTAQPGREFACGYCGRVREDIDSL